MIGDGKASNITGVIKSSVENCRMGGEGLNVLTKIKSENPGDSCSSSSDSTY